MKASCVATGFAAGQASPEVLLHQAIRQAKASLAPGPISAAIVLFSPAQLALPLAALQRMGRELTCLQWRAGTFSGVLSNHGHSVGRPACAVGLFAAPLGMTISAGASTLCHYAGLHQVPYPLPFHSGLVSTPASRFVASQGNLQTSASWTPVGPWTVRHRRSSGIRPLTERLPIHRQEGALLLQLERYSALPLLARNLPFFLREQRRLPLNQVLVGEWPLGQREPRYLAIVATDLQRSGLWLERPLEPDSEAFLAVRDPAAAERDTRLALHDVDAAGSSPQWMWVSSSSGRGADFFGGEDRDLSLCHELFPSTPVLGAYGLGEFWPSQGEATLQRFSKIFTFFDAAPLP